MAATAVALPLLFSESRKSQGARPSPVAAASAGRDIAAPLRGEDTASTDPNAAPAPNPTPLDPATSEIVIAVPTSTPDGQNNAVGRAAYRTWAQGSTLSARPCSFPGAPVNSVLRVLNLDNGRTTTCMVASNTVPSTNVAIVLDTGVFRDIADLVDSPVPVRVIWNG